MHPGHALEVGQWLMSDEEQYYFVPKNQQLFGTTFEENVRVWNPLSKRFSEEDGDPSPIMGQVYRIPGIEQVYSFEKKVRGVNEEEGKVRSVQIIEAKDSAFTSILGFHSSKNTLNNIPTLMSFN